MTNKQRELYALIRDTLDCDELNLIPKHRKAMTVALQRLKRGSNLTPQEAGYWSSIKKRALREDNNFDNLFYYGE